MKQALDCMFDKMTPSAWPGGAPRAQNPGEKLVWCITFSVVLLYAAIYGSLGLQSARADLPIHATTSAVKGRWLFSLSPPLRGIVHSCGSTTPNKNSSNLRSELQDYKAFLETQGGVFRQVRLHLADKPVPFSATRSYAALGRTNRQSWKALGVYDGENPSALVGSWTTVYDEGFEVDIGDNLRMMGFMKYSLDPACKRFPVDGDLEDASGNTKCYVTDARKTHMGWYIQRPNQGEPLSGCFYAERIDGPSSSDGASAFVVIDEAQTPHGVSFRSSTPAAPPAPQQQPIQTRQDLTYYISQEFINSHNASPTASWKAGSNPVFAQVDAASLSKYIKDFGVKKVYRRGSGGFEANHSFVQSGGNSSTSEDPSADQLYACPCKKGEHRLDTRRNNNEPAIPVLSPLSVLEVGGGRSFLSSISPHNDKPSSLVGKEEEGFTRLDRNPVEAIVHRQQPTKAHLQNPSDVYTVPVASLETSETELPANFSWSDPFSGGAFEDEVSNQGPCGSCYAVAATYALQKRFEVAASKMLGREVKLFGNPSGDADVASRSRSTSFVDLREEVGAKGNLSAQSILSCSFYNQGCDGGFPFLVGKHARDIGIPQESCMRYEATDSATCPFQPGLLANIKNESTSPSSARSLLETESQACMSQARWYASDYGYVGACYECNQCSGEKLIMNELYQNGPVAAALEAPPSLFSYQEGIYDVDSSKHHHSRVCDVNNPECNGVLTGWEFTNHAITLVGWGEESPETGIDNAAPRKYWIVRNTWGPYWGEKGYVKIARGKNLGGIESQATWMDPDFTRGVGRNVAEKIEALKGTEAASA